MMKRIFCFLSLYNRRERKRSSHEKIRKILKCCSISFFCFAMFFGWLTLAVSLGSLAALSSANGGEDSEEMEEAVTGADDEGKKYRTNHSLA